MTLEVIRFLENNKQTISKFVLFDKWNCNILEGYILELPNKENKRSVSRINSGTYKAIKRNSPKFKDHFHILGVEDRDYILIHHGNFNSDTRGCLLPGAYLADINKDGLKDVCESKKTMKLLNKYLTDEFVVIIKEQFEKNEGE